jgi:hypothetical protein
VYRIALPDVNLVVKSRERRGKDVDHSAPRR